MRPLIIDDLATLKLDNIRKNAERNIISFKEYIEIAEGKSQPVGNRGGFSCILPFEYRVVYSIEFVPDRGLMRHMSISVPAKDKLPNHQAVIAIMHMLGFTGGLQDCIVYVEDSANAINVMQPYENITHQ